MEFSFWSAACLAGAALGIFFAFKLLGSKERKTKKVPRGTVLLHQFKRDYVGIPNLSPPCLKLETYLRMAKIPYECDFSPNMSSKGKMPWIEYNGQKIADSNFCIEFLNKEFGVDVDDHLSEEQKGIARSVLVMLEENTYWTLGHFRFLGGGAETARNVFLGNLIFPLKYLVFRFLIQRTVKGYLYCHGIGRHSVEEIYGIAEKDLTAVSEILGKKNFLFGDKPCLADVVLFSYVCSFVFLTPVSPQGKLILTKLKNLEEHCNRIKETFYPDWDELSCKKKEKSE